MVENIRKVGNPLTIIAIFAALAEVAGTIVLGVVPPAIQSIFVWFVMGFPVLLILLFFGTLFLKSDVLYAPSDFADEKNYMELKNRAGNVYDQVQLVRQQFADLISRIDSERSPLLANGTQAIQENIEAPRARESAFEEKSPGKPGSDEAHNTKSVDEQLRTIEATLIDVEREAEAVAISQDKLVGATEVRLWIILTTLKEADIFKLAEAADLGPKSVLLHLHRMRQRGRAKRLPSGNWAPVFDAE